MDFPCDTKWSPQLAEAVDVQANDIAKKMATPLKFRANGFNRSDHIRTSRGGRLWSEAPTAAPFCQLIPSEAISNSPESPGLLERDAGSQLSESGTSGLRRTCRATLASLSRHRYSPASCLWTDIQSSAKQAMEVTVA